MDNHVTVNLGLRYDLEILPIPETDDPLVTTYPKDTNNLAPRIGADLHARRQGVVRAGVRPVLRQDALRSDRRSLHRHAVHDVVRLDVPGRGPPTSGRATGSFPTDPFLVNGPVLNRTLLDQMFPAGSVLRNTGATWDNPDRRTPYTDEYSIGYERELVTDLAASVDYVHSQNSDLLMALNLNPQVRSNSERQRLDAHARAEPDARRRVRRS